MEKNSISAEPWKCCTKHKKFISFVNGKDKKLYKIGPTLKLLTVPPWLYEARRQALGQDWFFGGEGLGCRIPKVEPQHEPQLQAWGTPFMFGLQLMIPIYLSFLARMFSCRENKIKTKQVDHVR